MPVSSPATATRREQRDDSFHRRKRLLTPLIFPLSLSGKNFLIRTRYGIILLVGNEDKIKEKTKKIAQKYALSFVVLFGSQATGRTHQKSDFDIAYLSETDLNLEQESNLIFDLSVIFRNENIDLLNLKNAKPLLYYGVFKNCRVIFEKTPLMFQTLRTYAFKKYVETKPLYEEKFKRLEEKIAYI